MTALLSAFYRPARAPDSAMTGLTHCRSSGLPNLHLILDLDFSGLPKRSCNATGSPTQDLRGAEPQERDQRAYGR